MYNNQNQENRRFPIQRVPQSSGERMQWETHTMEEIYQKPSILTEGGHISVKFYIARGREGEGFQVRRRCTER